MSLHCPPEKQSVVPEIVGDVSASSAPSAGCRRSRTGGAAHAVFGTRATMVQAAAAAPQMRVSELSPSGTRLSLETRGFASPPHGGFAFIGRRSSLIAVASQDYLSVQRRFIP